MLVLDSLKDHSVLSQPIDQELIALDCILLSLYMLSWQQFNVEDVSLLLAQGI